MGLFGGLLGWEADDERLPNSPQALADAGVIIRIMTVDVGDPHPNTYRLTLRNAREQHALIAISTGGGMMEVISLDGVPMNMDGGYHETLIWQPTGSNPRFEADEISCTPAARFRLSRSRPRTSSPLPVCPQQHPSNDSRPCCPCLRARICACPSGVVRRCSPTTAKKHAALETRCRV